jgi:hypothetical protein
MMNQEANYFAELEYNNFQFLVNKQLYLTKEEYDFVISYDPDVKNNFMYIGKWDKSYDYLNLNLYSEHDHEKRQYEMETGVNGSFDNL